MFAPRVTKPKAADTSSPRAAEGSIRVARRAVVDQNRPRVHGEVTAAMSEVGGTAGSAWDPAEVPASSSDSDQRPSLSIGSWARAMARADETSPADAAERSADRAAGAAIRDELPAQARGVATAADAGPPPWGAGRPLSLQEREWHEPRVGASLREVRVHEGAAPSRWAAVLGARAFAFGRDVVLGSGEYAPGTLAGRRLMAHELSHVVSGRGRAPVLARVALTPADFDALAGSIHSAVGSPALDEELIYVALQKLERDQAAIASLKSAYRRLFNADLLADLGTRLKGHGLGLAETLLGQAKGPAVAAAPPSTPAEFESIARAVNAALAATPIDAQGIYAALIPLGRTLGLVAALKNTYTRLFKTDLEADLTAKLAPAQPAGAQPVAAKQPHDARLSYALYLLQAQGPASPHSPTYPSPSKGYVARPGFGTSPSTTPVPGGTVTTGEKVPYSFKERGSVTDKEFSFGYGYTGALSSDTRWLQFVYRQIIPTTAAGTRAIARDVTVGSRTYPLTTDAQQPNWVVDSDKARSPFFDETHSGTSWRDATSVSAYDAPSPLNKVVEEQFDAGATRVVSLERFDAYLIRDFAPIFHVVFELVWTYTSRGRRTMTRSVIARSAVSQLQDLQKADLVARYPAFAYIK